MIGEDSAIRAAYVQDRATLELTSVLAGVWTGDSSLNRDLGRTRSRLVGSTNSRLAGDDSAPRAVSAYNNALLNMWNALAAAKGQDAAAIVATADRENAVDDSAWRVADRLAEAQVKIVLK